MRSKERLSLTHVAAGHVDGTLETVLFGALGAHPSLTDVAGAALIASPVNGELASYGLES